MGLVGLRRSPSTAARSQKQTQALPNEVEHWSLTTLREKLVKIAAKVVRHGRYVTFQLAEVVDRDYTLMSLGETPHEGLEKKTLLDQGVHTSLALIRDRLSTHQVATVVLPTSSGATLRIRNASTPDPEHRQIYRQLKVLERVMVPKRTWSEPCPGSSFAWPTPTTGPPSAINGARFLAWVQQALVATLAKGDIVIMDNLTSHNVAGVREAIEAVDATPLYLPPRPRQMMRRHIDPTNLGSL